MAEGLKVNRTIQNWLNRLLRGSHESHFWIMQVAGWAGLSVVSYFSLNLWYDQPDLSYVGHNVVQSLLGIALSSPLRNIYRAVWDYPPLQRGVIISLAVLVFASLWACLRLLAFEAMTEESGLWSDFGGWLFPSIFIFLCWTAFYHGMKYYRLAEEEHSALLEMASERNVEAAKAARAESTAREAQLTMLRYQLNPHFLFNTLNGIQSLVASRQNERANAMISSLSEFLRYSLYTETHKLVTVEEEIRAVQLYLGIEQARFRDRLTVEIEIADEARHELMPNMLLQPLVENAIKYGIAPCESGGTLRIHGYCDGTHLNIDVTDSGCGNEGVTPITGLGVGLENIRSRLENAYGNEQEFVLRRQPGGGMCAEIRIPLFAERAVS